MDQRKDKIIVGGWQGVYGPLCPAFNSILPSHIKVYHFPSSIRPTTEGLVYYLIRILAAVFGISGCGIAFSHSFSVKYLEGSIRDLIYFQSFVQILRNGIQKVS